MSRRWQGIVAFVVGTLVSLVFMMASRCAAAPAEPIDVRCTIPTTCAGQTISAGYDDARNRVHVTCRLRDGSLRTWHAQVTLGRTSMPAWPGFAPTISYHSGNISRMECHTPFPERTQ